MTYEIVVTEILSRVVEIEATSEKEALKKVEMLYKSEEIILDSDDHEETIFEVLSEEGI
jgi:hypothetical protein